MCHSVTTHITVSMWGNYPWSVTPPVPINGLKLRHQLYSKATHNRVCNMGICEHVCTLHVCTFHVGTFHVCFHLALVHLTGY